MSKKDDDNRNRVAIGGQEITLTAAEAREIGNFKVCAGGTFSHPENPRPHRAKWRGLAVYWTDQGERREMKLELPRARAMYFCRKCNRYMGCAKCIQTVLLGEIECFKCGIRANEIGLLHHGEPVRRDPVAAQEMVERLL